MEREDVVAEPQRGGYACGRESAAERVVAGRQGRYGDAVVLVLRSRVLRR
jgi:hypothetical protein